MTGLDGAIELLRKNGASLVVVKDGTISEFYGRGVSDLFRLLHEEGGKLKDALVADKVVGKGAAALMILGGVKGVYAELISAPALALFAASKVSVSYGELTPGIINRAGTGPCPVEQLCSECQTAEECLPLITEFLANLKI